MESNRHTAPVIGVPIDVMNWPTAISRLVEWGRSRESRYVCICNVHSVVTAAFDAGFKRVTADADMATSDGAPVAWMLRQLGAVSQQRINGPDLMWRYLAAEAPRGGKVFLYGGREETLQLLSQRIRTTFPDLQLVGAVSPPFRALTAEEDEAMVAQINASGAHIVFVGLGCPKQEIWMAEHRGRVNAVMVGVGAAFDYHAGTIPRAPRWMRRNSLEWLHRLASEPRRLWKRYLVTNAAFLFLAIGQWAATRITGARPAGQLRRTGATQWDTMAWDDALDTR
jgi:N-acetylglucosaminyldiphosphoundecaprenol N-acetyl-beta-D-mannosaminyltransferase